MLNFDDINVKQLITISKILSETKINQKNYIERKFIEDSKNFISTNKFLKSLNLIYINSEILVKNNYRIFLDEYKKKNFNTEFLQKFFLERLLIHKNHFLDHLEDFLIKFSFNGIYYSFDSSRKNKIKFSGVRNLLIGLGLIKLDYEKNIYIIEDKFVNIYKRFVKNKKISPEKLKKSILEKEKIGNKAELEILNYEKRKLANLPFLQKKIEHISKNDVKAGYDIKSFENNLDKNNNPIPIYIEVKAVPIWNYEFYWSRNEIEKAEKLNDKYYLYLLPAKGNNFIINELKKIKNPYKNIYKNKKNWIRTQELMCFSLSE
ncbi:MAG: protein NO VEIN domain-containing protein [Candidatus Helarchaeota archaeon]